MQADTRAGAVLYEMCIRDRFKDSERLQELSDIMYEMYKDKGITKVVGIESRGFIMGPILATRLGAGFIPIRKPGKLPAETMEESYDKEYGKDTVQIHKDALNENDVVLLHDDLLACLLYTSTRPHHKRNVLSGELNENDTQPP